MKYLCYTCATMILLLFSNSASAASAGLQNPIQVDSLNELFVALLNIFIILSIPIIVIFIILAGFKYVMAQGNATKVEEASRALLYAIVGGVLILGAVVLIEIISNVVDSFRA